jgi:hypothetical protein
MLHRLSTGEMIDQAWTQFSYPSGYHYDVLRGLDYLRSAGAVPTVRAAEAVGIVESKRGSDGRWGPLVNLGPLVNGPGDDRCPAWTPDLRIFLFDSVREGGFGARDIWWVYFKDVTGYPLATVPAGASTLVSVP